jgi:zinc transport system ATP-binding protein
VIAHDGAVPHPTGHHADPSHEHVHPHEPQDPPSIWGSR